MHVSMDTCRGCPDYQRRIEVYSDRDTGCGVEFYVEPPPPPIPEPIPEPEPVPEPTPEPTPIEVDPVPVPTPTPTPTPNPTPTPTPTPDPAPTDGEENAYIMKISSFIMAATMIIT